jgi:2'-5' RNA ligase
MKTRTFIAIEASDEVRAGAMAAADRLRRVAEGVKWVDRENLHWTLQFLGDIDDAEIAEVCRRVGDVTAGTDVFPLTVVGVGAFPNSQRPKTLWVGVGDGATEMVALQAAIETALSDMGFRSDRRRYVPHLTIGRVGGRSGGLNRDLADRLAKLADEPIGEMTVDAVTLYASRLARAGAAYTVLARLELR